MLENEIIIKKQSKTSCKVKKIQQYKKELDLTGKKTKE
jgi:hypothetical protein